MRTAAILPVKRFSLAKQRLGESVAEQLRHDLARAMVGDVLVALSQSSAIELTVVVTNEPLVAAAAAYTGATVVADTAEQGQSAAVSIGIERAVSEGAERVLCIPGDCPALDPHELDALLGTSGPNTAGDAVGTPPGESHEGKVSTQEAPATASDSGEVVVIPDRHGTGTNGLLLAPPDAILPSFGPGSCARHGELAEAAGARWRIERVGSLLLDIDTGEDLAALRERLADKHGQAPRTRSVLGLVEEHWQRSQPAA
jgi:2-phospho-L-lactate guanylyltransferase